MNMPEEFKKRKKRPDSFELDLNVDLSKGVKKVAEIVQEMDRENIDRYIEIGEKEIGPKIKATYGIGVRFLDTDKKKYRKLKE